MRKVFWDRQGANIAILRKELQYTTESFVFVKTSDVRQRIILTSDVRQRIIKTSLLSSHPDKHSEKKKDSGKKIGVISIVAFLVGNEIWQLANHWPFLSELVEVTSFTNFSRNRGKKYIESFIA